MSPFARKTFVAPLACGLSLALSSGSLWAAPLGKEPHLLKTSLDEAKGTKDSPALAASSERETVRERYPNRNVKIERQVTLDAEGNYVNHGTWTMWDEKGRLLGSGEYVQGKRQGQWVRNFEAGEAEVLGGPLSKLFKAPFVSTGTFVDDQLSGAWSVVDAEGRQVFEWNYQDNHRDGKCAWLYPNGEVWRQVEYLQGEPHGEFTEWAPDGELIAKERFDHGRREVVQVEWYAPGVKKTEALYSIARERVEVELDWWAGVHRIKVTGREGKDLRNGPYITWHRNGQMAMQGKYVDDQPDGKFHFWHPNGQKAIEGEYVGGLQTGRWTWWHENGVRQIQGAFERGAQEGQWSWWSPEGKLAESAIYSDTNTPSPANENLRPKLDTARRQPKPQVPTPADDVSDEPEGGLKQVARPLPPDRKLK